MTGKQEQTLFYKGKIRIRENEGGFDTSSIITNAGALSDLVHYNFGKAEKFNRPGAPDELLDGQYVIVIFKLA